MGELQAAAARQRGPWRGRPDRRRRQAEHLPLARFRLASAGRGSGRRIRPLGGSDPQAGELEEPQRDKGIQQRILQQGFIPAGRRCAHVLRRGAARSLPRQQAAQGRAERPCDRDILRRRGAMRQDNRSHKRRPRPRCPVLRHMHPGARSQTGIRNGGRTHRERHPRHQRRLPEREVLIDSAQAREHPFPQGQPFRHGGRIHLTGGRHRLRRHRRPFAHGPL